MKFGDNLKKLRKLKHLSQEELAEKVGVSRQSVSKWECGDAYPEMFHILFLCDIFHCKINELVHEDFVDIDSLDEEVKMSIVKFKKEKQRKIRGISKAIYFCARIGQILLWLGISLLLIVSVATPFIISNVKLESDKIQIYNESLDFKVENNLITINNETIYANSKTNIREFIYNHSNMFYILSIEYIIIIAIVTLFLVLLLLRNLEKLFINIYQKETPFILENVTHIKKIAYFIIGAVILPDVAGFLYQLFCGIDMHIEFQFLDLLFSLVVFSLAYIFEYGYEVQLDSKGKIYGDSDE